MAMSDVVAALVSGDAMPGDTTDQRILEAAVERFTRFGIQRTNADDIARAAKVNRTTLYRRIGSKDTLVIAAMAFEVSRMKAEVVAESDAISDSVDRLLHGFVATLTALRANQWIRQLVRDREIEFLVDETHTLFRASTALVAEQIRRCWSELGLTQTGDADVIAAILVRLIQSLVVIPDAPPVLKTPSEMRAFADTYVRTLIFSTV